MQENGRLSRTERLLGNRRRELRHYGWQAGWSAFTALLGVGFLLFFPAAVFQGMGWSFLLLGSLQTAMAGREFLRALRLNVPTDDPPALESLLHRERERLQAAALLHTQTRTALTALFLLGLALLLGGVFINWGEFALGAGAAVMVQASFALVFELFAEWNDGLLRQELEKEG